MKNKMSWALFGLLVLLLPSCGFKTLPVPPQDVYPAPITDLHFELDGPRVTLSWTIPRRTTKGEALPYIGSYQIFRGVEANEEYCPSCPPRYTQETEVPVTKMAADKGIGRYSEPLLQPGFRYFYKMRVNTGWHFTSVDSNPISFVWLSPPKAPRQVAVQVEEQGLTLVWQPPESFEDGTPIGGPLLYRVYRSTAGTEYKPMGNAPTADLSYHDQGLVNGRSYSYKVKAIRTGKDSTLVAGLPSAVVAGTPIDLTPPAPPTGLSLVSLDQAVRVTWIPGTEEDLAGYRIYRRLATATKGELLGTVPAPGFTFIDRQLPEGGVGSWFYSVTAFDRAEPPNESGPSPEIGYSVGK